MARIMRFCHFLQKRYGTTDGRTDGQTQPLIEMRGTHLKIGIVVAFPSHLHKNRVIKKKSFSLFMTARI